MRISQRAQYAVAAVLDLAVQDLATRCPTRGLRSAEIARRARVPEKFLEAILRDLRAAGLVASKRGPDGGHRLIADPRQITVLSVVEIIDGPLVVGGDTSAPPSGEVACTQALWGRTVRAVRETLAARTLEDLRREAVAPGPVDFII